MNAVKPKPAGAKAVKANPVGTNAAKPKPADAKAVKANPVGTNAAKPKPADAKAVKAKPVGTNAAKPKAVPVMKAAKPKAANTKGAKPKAADAKAAKPKTKAAKPKAKPTAAEPMNTVYDIRFCAVIDMLTNLHRIPRIPLIALPHIAITCFPQTQQMKSKRHMQHPRKRDEVKELPPYNSVLSFRPTTIKISVLQMPSSKAGLLSLI